MCNSFDDAGVWQIPADWRGTVIISDAGRFFYRGTPAFGNLHASNAREPGTDPYGNVYRANGDHGVVFSIPLAVSHGG